MTLVVDSSAVINALLRTPSKHTIGRLLGFGSERVLAPELMWSETTAVFRLRVWKGEIEEGAGRGLVAELFDSGIEPSQSSGVRPRAWDIARDMGWARTYDAEYCALAELEKASLVTADLRLVRAAEGRLPYVVAIDDV